jgi:hypothetical protein
MGLHIEDVALKTAKLTRFSGMAPDRDLLPLYLAAASLTPITLSQIFPPYMAESIFP